MRSRFAAAAVSALFIVTASDAGERAWYASIEGGVTSVDLPISQSRFNCPGSLFFPPPLCVADDSKSSGAAVIGAIGTHIGNNFRIEGEVGYRSNEIGSIDTLKHTTLMLNGVWDVPLTDNFSLSLGGGVGIDRLSTSEIEKYIPVARSETTAFAYQGVAGLSYALSDSIAITASYRRLETSSDEGISAVVRINSAPPLSGLGASSTPSGAVFIATDKTAIGVFDTSADTVSVGLRISF